MHEISLAEMESIQKTDKPCSDNPSSDSIIVNLVEPIATVREEPISNPVNTATEEETLHLGMKLNPRWIANEGKMLSESLSGDLLTS